MDLAGQLVRIQPWSTVIPLRVLTALRKSPVGDVAVLVSAEGYAPVLRQVEIGLERLLSILENLDG